MLRNAKLLVAVVALVAMFLPAVRLDLSSMPRPTWSKVPPPAAAWQVRSWSTAAVLPAGWRTIRGQPNDFAAGMNNLDLGREILATSNQQSLQVSGIFRVGPYLAVPLLLAVALFALAVVFALLRRPGPASVASALAFVSSFFAVLSFVWMAVVAHSQRVLLQSLADARPGGLQLRVGLFLLPAALLAFSLLTGREEA